MKKISRSAVVLAAILATSVAHSKIKTKPQAAAQRSVAKPAAAPPRAPAQVQASRNKPKEFVSARAQKVISALKARPLQAEAGAEQEIASSANKQDWLNSIYRSRLVDTSWATKMLSDKRIMAEVVDREMGEAGRAFYPKTLGLREFLAKYNLTNRAGRITADGEEIEAALYKEFPAGFVARPAVGVAPQETGRGLFADTDSFVVNLLKENSPYYQPSHMQHPVRSHILDAVASGEAVVLQEDLVRAADAKKPLKTHYFQEVRVHTYEGRVVEGAVPARWVQTNLLKPEQIRQAEIRVGEFLKSLSAELLNRQAWGIDVAVLDNGEMRILDIVTNRGREVAWSGYLDQPRVIGAYGRHLEAYYGVRYQGWSGTLIRNNFANYMPFWQKRIEKAKPGWKKFAAYLPPVP